MTEIRLLKEFGALGQNQAGLLRDLHHLSIWEIAHRWHDLDPNLSDPQALPLPVQDVLRALALAVTSSKLHLLNREGINHINVNDIPPIEIYIPHRFQNPDNPADALFPPAELGIDFSEHMDPVELEKEYRDFYAFYSDYHYENTQPLFDCLENRKFDRDVYERTHLRRDEFLDYCINNRLTPPWFWYTEEEINHASKSTSKGENNMVENRGPHAIRDHDRELCRTIAATLWLTDPSMHIEQIAKHPAIQRIGNGKTYKGRDTIRNWIKDLDPRTPEERTGRPRKNRTKD